MKRTITLMLTMLMLLSVYTGCQSTEDVSAETQPAETETETETQSPNPHWDAVVKTDLGGIEVNGESNEYDSNFYNVLDWDEYSGDRLNDAVYDRNRYIEEQLNCTLVVNRSNDPNKALEQAVLGGTGDVELVYSLMAYSGGILTAGMLKPFNAIDTVDISQPYWDQGGIRDLAIRGQMYHGYLDFGFDHYDSMAVLFYNGKIVEEYNLEDPYDLFMNQEWTTAKMLELLQNVSADLDGDGAYKLGTDMYGFAGREYFFEPIQFASGVDIITWDMEKDNFSFNMTDDRFLQVTEAISSIFHSGNKDFVNYSDYDLGRTAFQNGKVLIYSRLLGDFKQLRENEDDYGIMAFPRYDYNNEYTSYFVQNPTTLYLASAVGDDNGDGEADYSEIGLFLQAIGAYTYDFTMEEYTEKAVIGKGLRDEKSVEIFKIMIQNRSFCMSRAFNFQAIVDGYRKAVINGANYVSSAESMRKHFDSKAAQILEEINKNLG